MTGSDFKTWLRGYLEGVHSSGEAGEGWENVVHRIEEEANKIDAAPVVVQDWWITQPNPNPLSPLDQTLIVDGYTVQRDCGCPSGTICGNTACPRALTVLCDFPTTACVGTDSDHFHEVC